MRLAPLPADEWDGAVDEALAVMLPKERRTPDKASNILSTFVHHPALLKEFLRFNVHLLFRSTLPPRERELAILRVAHRTGSEYEWVQHVRMGKNEGLTEQDVAGVQRGEAADEFDRTILAAVDELDDDCDCRTRPGPPSASTSTSGSGWTWSSQSAATACWRWPSTPSASSSNRRGKHRGTFSQSRPQEAGPRTIPSSAPGPSTTPTPSTRTTTRPSAGHLQEDLAQRRPGRAASPVGSYFTRGAVAVAAPR